MQIERLEILRDGSVQLSRLLVGGGEVRENLSGLVRQGPAGLFLEWAVNLSGEFRTQLVVVSPWARIIGAKCRVDGKPVCAQDAQDATQVRYSAAGEAKVMRVELELDKYNLLIWPTPTARAEVINGMMSAGLEPRGLGVMAGVVAAVVAAAAAAILLKRLRGRKIKNKK